MKAPWLVVGGWLLVAAACGGAPDPPLTAAPADSPPTPGSARCGQGRDGDRDGLSDACEEALSEAFAPVLVAAPRQCFESAGLPPGGYFHGAQRVGDVIRLVYLPAYFRDCGWTGIKCRLPGVDCAGHAGDSELIALDLRQHGEGWTVAGVFLSAHCFDGSADGCRWYRDAHLDAFDWMGAPRVSAPRVWVSEGRNANYPSARACDRGHYFLDSCDRNSYAQRFPVAARRNIGSAALPMQTGSVAAGCAAGRMLDDPRALRDAVECFWSEEPFRGWQAEGSGSTPYVRYLDEVAELR